MKLAASILFACVVACMGQVQADSLGWIPRGSILNVDFSGNESIDRSSYANTGIFTNGAAAVRGNLYGNDYATPAGMRYSNKGMPLAVGSYTMGCWMYQTAATSSDRQFLINKENPVSDFYGLVQYTGKYWHWRSSATTCTNGFIAGLSNWVHVAGSRSGTTTKLYVNGILEKTVTESVSDAGTTNAIWVGRWEGANYGLVGYRADPFLTYGALSDAEIMDIYLKQKPKRVAP